VKPPASIESEEARRPTFDEDAGRRAAAATDGEARFVGNWETDEIASPQAEQKRAGSGTPAPHFGHGTKTLDSNPRKKGGRVTAEKGRPRRAALEFRYFAAAFVALPSMAVVQVFPSSDISSLKAYASGDCSVIV